MNTLVIVLIAVAVLGAGYVLYGRRIAKNGALIPKRKLPPLNITTARITCPQTAGRFSAINFRQSRVQAP